MLKENFIVFYLYENYEVLIKNKANNAFKTG